MFTDMDSPNEVHAGTGTLRSRRKAATRAALEAALRRCLTERGYDGTSVADVTRAAGVATGTFYLHFASKEAALDAMLERFNGELVERLATVLVGPRRDLDETIAAAAAVFLDYLEAQRWLVECYVRRAATGVVPEALRDGIHPPVSALLQRALESYAEERGATASWDLVTHGLLALWLRIGLRYVLSEGVSRAQALDTLTRLSLGALAAVTEVGHAPR